MKKYKIVKETYKDGKEYFYPKYRSALFLWWEYFYNTGEHKIKFLTENESEKFIDDYLNDKNPKKEVIKYK